MTTELQAQRNLKLLNILTFIFGFRGFEGVLAVYFAAISGSFAFAMTMFAILNFSSSFFEVPTGVLSDRIGRKKTMLLYYTASTTSVLLFFLAEGTMMLVAGAILVGFGVAMRSGAVSAYVYENLQVLGRESEFKRVEGKRAALGRYALASAGLLAAGIIFLFDIRAVLLVTLCVLLVGLGIAMFLSDIQTFQRRKANIYADIATAWKCFVHDPALRDLSMGRMIARGVGNAEYRFRSLFFAAIMPEWLVSIVMLLNNVISGIAMHATHAIVERFGIVRSLIHISIVDRILTVVLVIINTVYSAFAMNIVSSIAFGIREIAAEDLLQARYSQDQRATMGSLVGLGGGLLFGVVAIAAGILADHIGVVYTMLALQPVLLLAVYFFHVGVKKS